MQASQNIKGFDVLNITIPILANKNFLVKKNNLGIPPGSLVFGVFIRTTKANSKSINNKDLVSNADDLYLNLIDKKQNSILQEISINSIQQRPYYFKPMPAANIDWNKSFFEYKKGATIPTDEDVELLVLYTQKGCNVKPKICFQSGRNLLPYRYINLEIKTEVGTNKYSLSTQNNIGISKDAVIVGFNLNVLGNPYDGNTRVSDAVLRSSFLSIIKNSKINLDRIPLDLDLGQYPRIDFENQFFPIVPKRVGDIDWQRSEIFCANSAVIANGQSYRFELVYVEQENL